MTDPIVDALEAKGLQNVVVERAPEGHPVKVKAEKSDGVPIVILMDKPVEDQLWVNAVLARADPEGFMASLVEQQEGEPQTSPTKSGEA